MANISLQEKFPNLFAVSRSKNKTVAEVFLEDNNSWNLAVPRRINATVRREFDDLLTSLENFTINKDTADQIQWALNSKGDFQSNQLMINLLT